MRAHIPDPQDPSTFVLSRLSWDERLALPHVGVIKTRIEIVYLSLVPYLLQRLDENAISLNSECRHLVRDRIDR